MGDNLKGRIAVVTGASAGIGLSTAEVLANLGVTVIACARNVKSIEARMQFLYYFSSLFYHITVIQKFPCNKTACYRRFLSA